jgi:tRNA(Ile2) C34 agmatinyltransferase TiaS
MAARRDCPALRAGRRADGGARLCSPVRRRLVTVVGTFTLRGIHLESIERRLPSREPDPSCPNCNAPFVPVALRGHFVLYYRCGKCGEMWGTRKPAPDTTREGP